MRRESIIAGLICLNLGLLAGWAYIVKQRRAVTSDVAQSPRGPSNSWSPRTITRTVHAPMTSSDHSGRFTWRFLESNDFKQYIANLRAVACPEQTIQDIIVAEVNKLYAGKEAALRLRPEHLEPWEVFGVSRNENARRERKLRELLREKRGLLKELLGVDVPVEMPAQKFPGGSGGSGREARYEAAYAKLPEAKRDAVRAIQESYWSKKDDLSERTLGFWEPEDHAEQRKLQKEYRDALAKTLTPDELTDYDFAASGIGNALRRELTAFNASEQEMREIFKLRWKVDTEFSGRDPNDHDAHRRRSDLVRANEAAIKSLLGDQRYAEYQRSRDSAYRSLSRLASESGLPAESAVKAYEAQRFAREEANKVRSLPDLTREQRDDLLRQMQGDLDNTMGQLLGPDVYLRFQENYGGRIFRERSSSRPVPPAGATVITVP